MQTLQQLRARHALEKVRPLIGHRDAAKMKARASELPFLIHSSGLGQAAAFFKSKSGDGYPELFDILEAWLISSGRPYAGRQDLMAAITASDMQTYRIAQAEAMHYMHWVKTFARAYLD